MDSVEAVLPSRPPPVLTDDNEGYWMAAQEGRLVVQQCHGCGRFRHPPRPMCPDCHSLERGWHEASGLGVIYSHALLHYPQHPAFDYPVPAVLVALDEGVRILSNVIDVERHAITIGLPVQVDFVPVADGFSVPVFRPRPQGV